MTQRQRLAGGFGACLLLVLSSISTAAGSRPDYDLDNDGLIEINNLADLNEIRNNLDGTSLYASSDGCPADGCNGFELTADLNFDTNGDGEITDLDDYWNEGEGWDPLGANGSSFTAKFEGNYKTISNTLIDRPTKYNTGLFGYLTNAEIHRLKVEGQVSGSLQTGLIVGHALESDFSELIAHGYVNSDSNYVGGIAGRLDESTLFASAAHTQVNGNYSVGGVIGYITGTELKAVYATGSVISTGSAGGITGYASRSSSNTRSNIILSYTAVYILADGEAGAVLSRNLSGTANSLHWVTDNINVQEDGVYFSTSGGGFSKEELSCPQTADNGSCTEQILYSGWGGVKTADNAPVWVFGSSDQLPALQWGDKIYRDSDADGTEDQDDIWPLNYAASQDSDNDGFPDAWTIGCDKACQNQSGLIIDHYPTNRAVSLNLDADNFPDVWNSTCDVTCQNESGLILDEQLNDRDNDGILDTVDSVDNNIAGNTGDIDADSDGLIDISTLQQLNVIRFQPDGAGLKLSENGDLNSSGCPLTIVNGQPKALCIGYELMNDLDFDTSQNGEFDSNDSFWNGGKGFIPIPRLEAILEGNNHHIKNLTINSTVSISFITGVYNSEIRNLGFTNAHLKTSSDDAGGIALTTSHTNFINVFYDGLLQTQSPGEARVGGIAGWTQEGVRFDRVFTSGKILVNREASGSTGGLIGMNGIDIEISNSFSSSYISGQAVGGLIGQQNSNYSAHPTITNSLYSGKLTSRRTPLNGLIANNFNSKKALTNSYWRASYHEGKNDGNELSVLACATSANNETCTDTPLYLNWSDDIWDFGTSQQLPALTFAGQTYRDSDGDGSFDHLDKWPYQDAASIDKDNDGYPDRWNPWCDSQCIAASGLQLDNFPDRSEIWSDSDLDGKPELCNSECATAIASSGYEADEFPGDTDNDGIPDAEDNNTDGQLNVDEDRNGLIEVHTLAELNSIRFQLDGTGYRELEDSQIDSTGCPIVLHQGNSERRCHGYEIMTDLNFDTNNDNKIDAGDDYWNEGKGWEPLSGNSQYTYFSATLNGNGHVIKNLYSNRPVADFVSLIGHSKNASIKNFIFDGELTSITGRNAIGTLSGAINNTQVSSVVVTSRAKVSGKANVGGVIGSASYASSIDRVYSSAVVVSDSTAASIIGRLQSSSLTNAVAAGSVNGDKKIGGAVGHASNTNPPAKLSNILSIGYVETAPNSGGITGSGLSRNPISSYWAVDTTTQKDLLGYRASLQSSRLNAETLKCAIQADTTSSNSNCITDADTILYQDWDTAIWDFGDNTQLPGIKIFNRIYRDSDGDGSLDENDKWKNNFAAYKDADDDGHPDFWAAHCDTECQISSELLALDAFPKYPNAWRDDDFDGLVEDCDQACIDASDDTGEPLLVADNHLLDFDNDEISDLQDTDRNGDGVTDADSDHDGLIEIDTLAKLDAIRNQTNGAGLRLSSSGDLNSSGCPYRFIAGQRQEVCRGYELTADLNFDTNNNGKIDVDDDFWNDGLGWESIGDYSNDFSGEFNGNGHFISNLYINSENSSSQGLFDTVVDSHLHDFALSGTVLARYRSALLAASLENTTVSNLAIFGDVKILRNSFEVGGISALAKNSKIKNVLLTGSVNGGGQIASFTPGAHGNEIEKSITTSYTTNTLGIVKSPAMYSLKESVFWLNYDNPAGESGYNQIDNNLVGLTLGQLQCATQSDINSDNSNCIESNEFTLYAGFSAELWDFGNHLQLPGLKLGNRIYRDSDGDGVIDEADKWPDNSAAAIDADGDSHPDKWQAACGLQCQSESGLKLDAFPSHKLAWQDDDLDGKPENCDQTCVNTTGLQADLHPNDFDNDGITDALDTDVDGDGIIDADADHDGLIDIATLQELDALRYQLNGYGQRLHSTADLDSSGCPLIVSAGVSTRRCHGYELVTDLNFDTNNDGQISTLDQYWNQGQGWQPIGDSSNYFSAHFNGNGYQIKNLYINQANENDVGLFSRIITAKVYSLIIDGTITGKRAVGLLAGSSSASEFHRIAAHGNVTATDIYAGVITGYSYDSKLSESITSGYILGSIRGGLIGQSLGQSSVTDSYSTVKLAPGNTPALPVYGRSGDGFSAVYWPEDNLNNQIRETDISNNWLAFPFTKLQCATSSDTTSENSDCVDSDRYTLYKDWDNTAWDFGTPQQLPALKIGSNFYRDSDGDGIQDAEDDKPFDHDNDAIADSVDGFPFIPIEDFVDTDNDGRPDECNSACLATGMAADPDDDNDRVDDVDDAFRLIAAASVDADNDGLPDDWTEGCNVECQNATGLTFDSLPNDTDNDGVTNDIDPDNGKDNGLPTLIAVGPTLYTSVNNENGTAFNAPKATVDQMFALLSATDVVDAADSLTFKAFLNGVELIRNSSGGATLPVGLQTIAWHAYDVAGNQSEAKQQQVYVYPQVRFATTESKVGEPDTANITVELSGPSPEYPIEIPLQVIVSDSTISQADINNSFNIFEIQTVRIERGDGETPNTSAVISVPVLQEFIDENNETLILNISAKPDSRTRDEFSYVLPESGRKHTLTILDMKDTDRDGLPDDCDVDCRSVGKTADNDDDGDNVLDVDDAFQLIAAAAVDADKDGYPDIWNDGCDATCRATSGLLVDLQLNDTDNDGVKNGEDSDNSIDNGKPILLAVGPSLYSPVNNGNGSAYIVTQETLRLMTSLLAAEDVVDSPSALRFQAIVNGVQLDLSGDSPVVLPSGLQIIQWYALDSADNRSEAKEQKVFVYPQIRFSSATSSIIENNMAEIELSLSGSSPEYPVEIPLSFILTENGVSQQDINAEFDLTIAHTVTIEVGSGEQPNTSATLRIPVIEDTVSEADETLVISISGKPDSQGGENLGFALAEAERTHTLMVTEKNLPPIVTLSLTQGGEVVDAIKSDGGIATITALVKDFNHLDEHLLTWDLNELGLKAEVGTEVTFNPAGLNVQEYKVVVTATDNGVPALSGQQELKFQLQTTIVDPAPGNSGGSNNSDSGGSSGGAIQAWYLLLMFASIYGIRRKYSR
jgi:hypothetical protein